MLNKINKTILSKFFIMLMIVSLFNPVVFAQGEVNPTPPELEKVVAKDDPVYETIDKLYSKGLISEEGYQISQENDLTRYEIALLVSNPLVGFLQSENPGEYGVDTVREFSYLLENYPNSLNALGFNEDVVGSMKQMVSGIVGKTTDQTKASNGENSNNTQKTVNYNPENLSRSKIAEIQYILSQVGLYKGEIDGLFGNKTKSAIEEYQRQIGLEVNGVLSSSLRASLLENLDVPENVGNLANSKLQNTTKTAQVEVQQKESAKQETSKQAEAQKKKTQNTQEKGNLAGNVEIHGNTSINYHKVDTSGNVPLNEDDEPIYEEKDTFEQVFNLDIIGHIAEGVKLVANLKAENANGLLSEGGNLSLEDVKLVGLQDDINKFVVGSQPAVNFGNLSYQSKGENGFSWQHNGDNYSLYTLYTIKDHTLNEDGDEVPLAYKRNTIGLRVATEQLLENIKLGLNFLNTKDDKVNGAYNSVTLPNKKSLTIASITGDYNKDDLTIGSEIAVMRRNDNTNTNNDPVTAYAGVLNIAKNFSEKLQASLNLKMVEEEYNAESLVDEYSYNEENEEVEEIESPYEPGEQGGSLDLAYSDGDFSSDLTLEYWDGKTEDASTKKGITGEVAYSKDKWGVSYNLEHLTDDGEGNEYKDHTLSGNYTHEFTRKTEDEEGKEVEEKFATITLEDSVNLEEDESTEEPQIITNTFTLATEVTPIENMNVTLDYTNKVNDNEDNKVENNSVEFAVNHKFEVNEKFTATPYYNAKVDNGFYDNPDTDEYDPYEVESIVQNVGVEAETVLIPEEVRLMASLSYNDFNVTKGKLDEDGYYISGNEPRKGFEATTGVEWTPKSIKYLEGLSVSVNGGKKVYDYEHKDSDKDQDSWTYSVGLGYEKEISDMGTVNVFYNRSEDIDEIEEYEKVSEEYGLEGKLNVNENTTVNASVSEKNTIDKSQSKDLTVVNNSIGITTKPVGEDGPAINLTFNQEEHQDKNNTDDNYKVKEIKGTVGGSF